MRWAKVVRRLTEIDLESLDADSVKLAHHRDLFEQFQAFQIHFTDRQWLALKYYYLGGLSKQQVGLKLGISAKAVGGLLVRAKLRLEEQREKERAAITRQKVKLLRESSEWS